jgi:microcystin-dependent protein
MALIAGVQYSGTPAGTIMPCGTSGALPRTLLCDGSAVSRTTYAALFAAISTTYGSGDGSTTFNLPDTRGIFLRGVGTNPSNASNTTTLGNRQLDDFKSHTHTFPTDTNGAVNLGNNAATGGNNTVAPAKVTNGTGGTETRPANLGVNYCIAF